jgi:hypothetical protein
METSDLTLSGSIYSFLNEYKNANGDGGITDVGCGASNDLQ